MAAGPRDGGWERALELAWQAFCAGTTPVGAVVLNAEGIVVAEARGRRYETAAPPGQLAGSHVAHAEVNALAQLGAGTRPITASMWHRCCPGSINVAAML